MEIITANKEFDEEQMHLDLMLLGVYIFHDPTMESIVDPETIEWEVALPHHGIAKNHPAAQFFAESQIPKFANYYSQLTPMEPVLYYGVDDGVGIWHTDAREKLGIQVMCYQEDFTVDDGGSIRVKCYDGVERWYYPKNGDVLVLNHHTDTTHMVEKIMCDKKRIAMNLKFK